MLGMTDLLYNSLKHFRPKIVDAVKFQTTKKSGFLTLAYLKCGTGFNVNYVEGTDSLCCTGFSLMLLMAKTSFVGKTSLVSINLLLLFYSHYLNLERKLF